MNSIGINLVKEKKLMKYRLKTWKTGKGNTYAIYALNWNRCYNHLFVSNVEWDYVKNVKTKQLIVRKNYFKITKIIIHLIVHDVDIISFLKKSNLNV